MVRSLVIGVGTDLRRDDAVGRLVAERIEELASGDAGGDVSVVVATQLVPELVDRIAASDRVVFVDASVSVTGVTVTPVEARPGSGDSHVFTPAALLALAERLGLDRPPAFLVQVAAHDLSLGEGLTQETAELVDDAVAHVLGLVHTTGSRPDRVRPNGTRPHPTPTLAGSPASHPGAAV